MAKKLVRANFTQGLFEVQTTNFFFSIPISRYTITQNAPVRREQFPQFPVHCSQSKIRWRFSQMPPGSGSMGGGAADSSPYAQHVPIIRLSLPDIPGAEWRASIFNAGNIISHGHYPLPLSSHPIHFRRVSTALHPIFRSAAAPASIWLHTSWDAVISFSPQLLPSLASGTDRHSNLIKTQPIIRARIQPG